MLENSSRGMLGVNPFRFPLIHIAAVGPVLAILSLFLLAALQFPRVPRDRRS
jgi:hypothetical protein